MAQINKPTDYFETTTYTGGATDVSSLSFQPDFVWVKKRDGTENHGLFDAVRGATKTINSNTTSAESTRSGSLTSFDNDGWSMGGSDGIISAPGSNYVGWSWKANGTGSANTDGSISSTVSANTTSGFSIVKYVSNGTAGATVGHGLGVAPKMVITFNLAGEDNWGIGHSGLSSWDYYLQFNTSAQANSQNVWNDTAPSTSLVTLGDNGRSNSSNNRNYIMYAFAEKQGYSKFGSYTGNNNDDGAFVYTGFKPAFVMVKMINGADDWQILDNKRSPHNIVGGYLLPNSSSATINNDVIDFTATGFKLRKTFGSWNHSSYQYLYMAFAEESFVSSSGVPATAR